MEIVIGYLVFQPDGVVTMQKLLTNQGYYGFGDTQYERMVSSLKPLFSSFDPVKLTKKGLDVLKKEANYYSEIRDNHMYLGGSLKYNFLYNTETDRILKL